MNDKTERFRALHRPGDPLVLFNVWDAGSAKTVARAGARALGTGSWLVAAALGYEDGEQVPRDLLIEVVGRIVRATDLPVTVDLESGFGDTPDAVAATVRLAAEAGAVGCNLEDSFPPDGALRPVGDAAARLAAAKRAGNAVCPGFFVNARTDVFFQPSPERTDSPMAEVLTRIRAYAEAGADGLFVPGLADLAAIRDIVALSSLPLNVMRGADSSSVREFADVGAARISHGPHPYRLAMKALETAAAALYR